MFSVVVHYLPRSFSSSRSSAVDFLNVSDTHVYRLADVDDFIAKLWDVHMSVKKQGYVQVSSPCSQGLLTGAE